MKKGGKRVDSGDSAPKKGKSVGGSRADEPAILKLWRGSKAIRVTAIVLGVILVLGSAAAIAWNVYVRLPSNVDYNPNPDFDDKYGQSPDVDPSASPGDIKPSSSVSIRPTPSPLTLRSSNIYTVLLVGTFDDGLTDTIMVATLDLDQERLDVISIPRDTPTMWNGKIVKINSIYSAAGGDEKGMEALKQEISTILGFKPNNYAMLKMSGFKKLVDTIGGVEFTVPFNMTHIDKDDSKSIRLKKGTYTLNGNQALQLMRFRVNDDGTGYNDYGRMETQQKFLMAVFKKMIQLGNWTKITDYVTIASTSIKPTDLDFGHMIGFAGEIMKLDEDKINFCTLPTATSGQGYFENIVVDEALELINKTVSPYSTEITEDHVEWPVHK